MNIRALGATGIRVGEIGMGCEGFIGKTRQEVCEFLDVMERSGANLIDLYSPDPEMRSALGEAMAGRRDSFVLQAHLCTIWKDGQYERTIYTSCCSAQRGIYYYTTYENRRISAVDMHRCNLDAAALVRFAPRTEEDVFYQN